MSKCVTGNCTIIHRKSNGDMSGKKNIYRGNRMTKEIVSLDYELSLLTSFCVWYVQFPKKQKKKENISLLSGIYPRSHNSNLLVLLCHSSLCALACWPYGQSTLQLVTEMEEWNELVGCSHHTNPCLDHLFLAILAPKNNMFSSGLQYIFYLLKLMILFWYTNWQCVDVLHCLHRNIFSPMQNMFGFSFRLRFPHLSLLLSQTLSICLRKLEYCDKVLYFL